MLDAYITANDGWSIRGINKWPIATTRIRKHVGYWLNTTLHYPLSHAGITIYDEACLCVLIFLNVLNVLYVSFGLWGFSSHTHTYIYNVLCISWPHTEHLPSCSPLVEALQRPKDKRKLAPKDAASTCREAANVLQEAIAQLSAAANVFEAAPATATAPQSSVAGVPPVVQVGRKGWEDGRMGVDTWKSLEIHRKVDWLLDWFLKGATVLQAPWIRWWVGSYNVISTPLSCITSIHLQSAVSLVLYQMDVGSSTGPLQSGALQLQVGL